MVSQTINVVRYSALFAGVLYGITHRRTLQSQENARKAHHAEQRHEHLVQQAKQAWKDKQASGKKSDNVISNPDDPNFDVDKLLAKWEKEYA